MTGPLAQPPEYPREYLTDALREITRCERLLIADAALSAIERHVQDMETALREIRDAVVPYPYSPQFLKDIARAALPASGTRNRVAREKGTE